ncbi:GDP-mannose-dependent alpha-mannosyltransferase [Anaerotruncus sp. 2789STDY5834896]|uniref:GDP-mannose-dependent alpha-mannosyltransferase n=1 Tax=uncultured Anaerotruncus sp. TaxID=905011 RepID=A0A1C6GSE4_9FIRM|nr:GDP-mannose-dependent alpha-mannosyltransferase [uncultured Anaerotruncus sp.]
MRIALFVETYLPYINGVVTHVHALKTGLEMLGHKVLVVTADPAVHHHKMEDGVLYCPCKKIKKLYGYGLASPMSRRREKLLSEFHPDIIHVHQEFGIGLFGFQYAKRHKIPMVYTMHTMYDDYLYYVVPKKLIPAAKKIAGKYPRMFARRAVQVTGPSKKVSEYLHSHGVTKSINVVPNPVELDMFSVKKADLDQVASIRQRYHYAEDDFVVCFVGRIGREKGLDNLFEMWAESLADQKHLKLMIVGDGPDRPRLVELSRQLGIGDQVNMIGKVEHEDLLNYLVACDLYVTASTSDTNSISMLEAMAVGLPVVHIRDDLNRGQVVEGVNGFIFSDAKSLRKKVMGYWQMPEKEKKAFKKSVVASVQNSGAKTLGENLERVYRNALQGK